MKTKLLFILFSFFILQSFSQEKIQKYSKAKIFYNTSTDFIKLLDNGIAVDHGVHKKNVFIESVFSQKELAKANSLDFQVEVLIDDMQKYIKNRKNTRSIENASCGDDSNSYETPSNFELGSMGGFYTYTQMLQELDDMYAQYPNLITAKAQVGTFLTYENRPIYFVKISDNPTVDETEPEMLFTAIHHAREPASMQQLIFYMWYLLENYTTNDEIAAILNNTEQFFIPVLNVDGYIFNETTNPNGGGMWRKNRRLNSGGSYGVDNNRNYSYHWNELGVSSSESGETWPGTAAFSEAENQASKWFCEQHNFVIALNNHTYSELLLYPFGYANDQPTPDDDTFEAISELMVQENGYTNQIAADLYPASGDSDDWMYVETSDKNKIYAMTPEIGYAFWPTESDIIPICKKMMFHNLTAAHLITNYANLNENTPVYLPNLNGTIDYTIKRLGVQDPASFTVSIMPMSSNITSVGSSQNHTSMAMLQENSGAISYTLDSAVQIGEEVKFKIVLDNGQFLNEKEITKIYGAPERIFNDDGTSLSNYNGTDWDISTSIYHSAPSAITDSNTGNYFDNTNSNIELANTIDLSEAVSANLSFFAKWDIEIGWDYVQFEISTDNGDTWIPQCGTLTRSGNINQGINGQPMYDGVQSSWVKEEVDLSDYLGESIKFRFQLVSDGNTTGDGFYFDDFEVHVMNNSVASILNNEWVNIKVYPNPFEDKFTIELPNISEELSVRLFSVNGQLMSEYKMKETKLELNTEMLNLGVYFINITGNNSAKTIKLIKK